MPVTGQSSASRPAKRPVSPTRGPNPAASSGHGPPEDELPPWRQWLEEDVGTDEQVVSESAPWASRGATKGRPRDKSGVLTPGSP